MKITIILDENSVKAIIGLMGETQAKQGFFPLMVEVSNQLEAQMANTPQERTLPSKL
jgi:hypothetical protein